MNPDHTMCGIGPAPSENGRLLLGSAVAACAKLVSHAERSGETELEARAIRAIEALMVLL